MNLRSDRIMIFIYPVLFFLLILPLNAFRYNDQSSSKLPRDDYEKMKCTKKLKSFDASLKELPINEVIVEVGKTFMGTPYVAGTLDENPHSEEVVIKITGLDCVTFVENSLVFSRLIKQGKTSFEDYMIELEKIRYRDGMNTGYPSRLHYFTDWIYDNEKKGIVKDITKEIGGVPYQKRINFMSSHRNSYKQLAGDDNNFSGIGEIEDQINARDIYYIPVEDIPNVYDKLQTGDIVGITSTIDGLDVAHTGYIYKQDGKTYLLNASLKDKQVEISPMELQDYILGNKKQGGIVVARVLDVN
ncbi:MAG: N-acetylmuramoyl-L-alanine amidase-like domain-containing protein [Ignavibacteria bacterium]